jgi:hypothetical protein
MITPMKSSRMRMNLPQLAENHQAEHEAEHADAEAAHEQRAAVDPLERDLPEIRQHEVRFASGMPGRLLLDGGVGRALHGLRRGDRAGSKREQQHGGQDGPAACQS